MSSVHYNAGHIYNAEAGYRMSLQFYTLYLGGILNDNLFVNPFSSDVISPTLHYVLNLMKKRNSLTIAPMNEYLQVNWFSSWVVHSFVNLLLPVLLTVLTIHYNAGHNHVNNVNT